MSFVLRFFGSILMLVVVRGVWSGAGGGRICEK